MNKDMETAALEENTASSETTPADAQTGQEATSSEPSRAPNLFLGGAARRGRSGTPSLVPRVRRSRAKASKELPETTVALLVRIVRALSAELFDPDDASDMPLLREEAKKPELLKNRVELLLKVLERLDKSRTDDGTTPSAVGLEIVDAPGEET